MKTNVKSKFTEKTHEGAQAARTNAEQQLRRSVMACMLFEGTFYEEGEEIAARIAGLISKVDPLKVCEIAVDARTKSKLRHVPLLIAREMARLPLHKAHVGKLLPQIIQRPDELTEFLSIYWKDDKPDARQSLSSQVKKGLAAAFQRFSEYSLAKYNSDGAVKLRDVLFLSHSKPVGEEQEGLYKRVIDGTMKTPDTWEVALSTGGDKKDEFTRLMAEKKLGALAFIRNLRNMEQAGVDYVAVKEYSQEVAIERVLPFRFISAARAVPSWEPMIEAMMLRCLTSQEKLPGKTVIVIDISGSMFGPKISEKSDIDRADAACALAILLREICEEVVVIAFSTEASIVPARHGFALRDAIKQAPSAQGGTDTGKALNLANNSRSVGAYDRIIVLTDEQSHTRVPDPLPGTKGYFVNVAVYKNGIGYGAWTHVDGWSEAIVDWVRCFESDQ